MPRRCRASERLCATPEAIGVRGRFTALAREAVIAPPFTAADAAAIDALSPLSWGFSPLQLVPFGAMAFRRREAYRRKFA